MEDDNRYTERNLNKLTNYTSECSAMQIVSLFENFDCVARIISLL